MNHFLKVNNNLLNYFLIILILVPIFGIKLFIGFISNILLLLFLIPLFLLVLGFIGFNSFKSQIKTCDNCGSINSSLSKTCINCGEYLEDISNGTQLNKKPSESTIEVKAEEIK